VRSPTLRGREVPPRSAQAGVAARARTKKMFRCGAAAPHDDLLANQLRTDSPVLRGLTAENVLPRPSGAQFFCRNKSRCRARH